MERESKPSVLTHSTFPPDVLQCSLDIVRYTMLLTIMLGCRGLRSGRSESSFRRG